MKKSVLKKFNNSLFITKEALRTISKDSEETTTKNIYRWSKSGDLMKLKNGLYISKEEFDLYHNTNGFKALIANRLRSPSYLSTEYVLSKYNILTEATYTVTSVTLKSTRKYENKSGTYTYRSIKDSLFFGYIIEKFLSHSYYIATKEKALFDYLYFKKNTLPNNFSNVNLVEELRLNIEDFSKLEFKNLEKFAKVSNDKKIYKIIKNIITNASNNI